MVFITLGLGLGLGLQNVVCSTLGLGLGLQKVVYITLGLGLGLGLQRPTEGCRYKYKRYIIYLTEIGLTKGGIYHHGQFTDPFFPPQIMLYKLAFPLPLTTLPPLSLPPAPG